MTYFLIYFNDDQYREVVEEFSSEDELLKRVKQGVPGNNLRFASSLDLNLYQPFRQDTVVINNTSDWVFPTVEVS